MTVTEKTILLVEDEVLIAEEEKTLLEENGYRVLSAHNGKEAVAACRGEEAIDLVLMDIDLGKAMDGTEAARRILAIREVPIVFLTNHGEKEMVDRVRHITRYGYVIKNSGDFVLLSSIEMAFELFEAHRLALENEERLNSLVRTSPIGIGIVDGAGTVTDCNQALADMVGYSREEVLSLNFADITHPDDLEEEWTLIKQLWAGMVDAYTMEKRYIHRDGRTIWVNVKASLVRNASGSGRFGFAFVNDVTEQRRSEEELKNREAVLDKIFDILPMGLWFADKNGKLLRGNPAGVKIWGAEPQVDQKEYGVFKARRLPSGEEIAPDDWALSHTVNEGVTVIDEMLEIDAFDGKKKIIYNYTAPVLNDQGEIQGAIVVNRDITDEVRGREALRESERKYRLIAEYTADCITTMDMDLRFTYVSPAIVRLRGYTPEEAMGQSLEQVLTPESIETAVKALEEEMQKEGKPGVDPNRVRVLELDEYHKNGSVVRVENSFSLLRDEAGEIVSILVISRDVTERVKAEKALRENEARVRRKLESILSPAGDIGSLDLSDIIDVEGIQSLMNYFYGLTGIGVAIVDLRGEVLVATGWQDICTKFHRVHPETRKYCIESDTKLSSGVPAGTFKLYRCKNNMWDIATPIVVGEEHLGNLFLGQFFFDDDDIDYDSFREQARRYNFNEKEYMAALDRVPRWGREKVDAVMCFYAAFSTLVSRLSYGNILLSRTLAERDRLLASLRESEARYRTFMDSTTDMVFLKDEKLRYMLVNRANREFFGLPEEEIVGKTDFDLMPEQAAELCMRSDHEAAATEGVVTSYEQVNDKIYESRKFSVPMKDNARGVGAFIRDITEHRKAEDSVRTLLAEKELLLKEVHHRVKNNMSTVAGMLSLQAGRMKNPESARALQEARDRVVGISRIYERLFQTGDYKSVRLSAYLPKLIDEIAAAAALGGANVRVEKDIDELEVGAKLLLPLGLILNEILTNAYKYAFPSGGPGRIEVSLKRSGGNLLSLTVSDDGVGMAKETPMEQKGGFGIMLVRLLVQQIEGTITPVEVKGTAWRIDFPAEQD